MAIEARLDNSLAARLHAHLVPKLRGAETKRIDDGLWLDFDDQGRISLAERPYDFLSSVWEVLLRLFTSKYARIERGICEITAEVNDYLMHENDPARLGAFINDFTPLVAELYRCAIKMARVHRIGQEVVDHLQAKDKLQELMTPYEHLGVPDRRYKFHGLFSVSSEMRDANVRFRFNNQEGLVGARDIEVPHGLQFNQVHSCDLKSTGNPVSLFVEVTREFSSLVEDDVCINLSSSGELSDILPVEGKKGVSFYNGSEHEMRVKIPHLDPDQGEFTIAPGHTRECGIFSRVKGREAILDFSITYTTESPPFQIGCPMAHYFVKMGANGKLTDAEGNLRMTVTPLWVNPLIPVRRFVGPNEGRLTPQMPFEHPNDSHRYLLVVLKGIGERRERAFIPEHRRLVRDYATFQRQFGVEWNGEFHVTEQYPAPVLAPVVMPTPPRNLLA